MTEEEAVNLPSDKLTDELRHTAHDLGFDVEEGSYSEATGAVLDKASNLMTVAAARLDSYRQARLKRQLRASEWATAAFGEAEATNPAQRGLRLAEEAIEAAQSAGCDPAQLHKLIDYIYSRPPGEMKRELGGVGLTLIVMADALGLDADECEAEELARVLSKPLAHFTARNDNKNSQGFKA